MKKFICLFLAAFFLFITPVKSLAASPVVFGMTEEIIWPFLASLLGLQAKDQITSLSDLKSYNIELRTGLENKLGYDIAGSSLAQEWVLNAVKGIIETDSAIWRTFRDFVIDNYTVASSDAAIDVNYNGALGNYAFDYYSGGYFTNRLTNGYHYETYPDNFLRISGNTFIYAGTTSDIGYQLGYKPSGELYQNNRLTASYTYEYNGLTVYYYMISVGGSVTSNTVENPDINNLNNTSKAQIAWLMVYGGYSAPVENVGYYSDAFADVLTSQEKEDIIDGTSVIQLYNPAAEQNGLHFVPDPEDPEDIKIPFAITADWWNYLQQFGSGDSSNQYVNAYNALNGLDQNTSTGRISNAYESLGIASLISSAADALQGIASLTDTNIYPAGQTVAQTINNTVPSSLTPVAPDNGITNDSEQGLYKLPDLSDYFPFCIPFDLIDFFSCLVAEPEVPHFIINLSDGFHTVQGEVDLEIFEDIGVWVRNFELAGFIIALILITRNLIRG